MKKTIAIPASQIRDSNRWAHYNAQMAPTPKWPCDPFNGRMICNEKNPMPSGAKGKWAHPNAVCTHAGEYSDSFLCEVCGAEWTEELAE